MADGKWIDGLTGSMPFVDAARRTLTLRLSAVGERLPLAVFHSTDDLEHVHQLRVSTRRAAAAVRIFAECFVEKDRRTVVRTLRSIRRAAGAARDWDVFQVGVAERIARAPAAQKPGRDFLLGYGRSQRDVAQGALSQLQNLASDEYPKIVSTVLPRLRDESDDALLGAQAVPRLALLLQELDAAALQDLNDFERLHQVRIIGKKLRYAMEIFADCFAEAFRTEIYPAIEEMQEILGRANDSHVAVGRLTQIGQTLEKAEPKLWKRHRAGIEGLLNLHQKRLPDQRRAFLRWWKKWRSSGTEQRLEHMLH